MENKNKSKEQHVVFLQGGILVDFGHETVLPTLLEMKGVICHFYNEN